MKTVKTYKGKIEKLEPNQVFTFGSNTEGRHGKGSALTARLNFGAIYGCPQGMQGQSFALITKDLRKSIHPSRTQRQIMQQIGQLYDFATKHPEMEFLVAYTGKGTNLNAYSSQEMANMFSFMEIPENIVFE